MKKYLLYLPFKANNWLSVINFFVHYLVGLQLLKNILFIVPYPLDQAASQRFRFEQYLHLLKENGYGYKVSSFLNPDSWEILYQKGHFFKKLFAIFIGYSKRLRDFLSIRKFDIVFIHREASPFGPPLFEWLFLKVSGKYSVFDFDDAIWIPNASESNWLSKYLKRFKNANDCCRWATVVSVGNKFLADHAAHFNNNVVINPTTIDMEKWNLLELGIKNKELGTATPFVIGWTGSHSTVQYLEELLSVFKKLEETFSFELHVVCDVPSKIKLQSMKFIKWKKETEIKDLLSFTIGIMPLPDNVWTRGKCGFKALQYMALGIPAVVSAVGVNAEIVDHNINGCVCRSMDDWFFYLSKLMSDKNYLLTLSKNTRAKILSKYSVQANAVNFFKLLNDHSV